MFVERKSINLKMEPTLSYRLSVCALFIISSRMPARSLTQHICSSRRIYQKHFRTAKDLKLCVADLVAAVALLLFVNMKNSVRKGVLL